MKTNKKPNLKTKFRSSVEWKEYRLEIIKERGGFCELCGCKSPKLSLHHRDLDPDNYTDLSNKSKHTLLCSRCHTTVHHYHTQLFKKDSNCNNPNMINLILNFFIFNDKQTRIIKDRFDTCNCCSKYINRGRTNK